MKGLIFVEVLAIISDAVENKSIDLDLSNYELDDLPTEFYELKELEILNLSDNNLKSFPLQITELPKLKELNLSNNQIEKLPSEIIKLKKLQVLSISNNNLKIIPPEIFSLKRLHTIDLSSNILLNLQYEILELENLDTLNLSRNPIENIPSEIIKQGKDSIFNYINSIQDTKEYDMLYEAKMVLVGRGGMGKTTLVTRLANEDFILDDHQQIETTKGVKIDVWDIPIKLRFRDSFRLNVWDFGGQKKYDATHQLFLTEKTIYLFVSEARREDNYYDFDYWLSTIRLFSNSSPVIVVQTKIDERKDDLPSQVYREIFSNIIEFVPVSCKRGYSGTIKELKRNIRKSIYTLPQVGDLLPKTWVNIRNEIGTRKSQNYISYFDYLEICRKNGLDAEKANLLSGYFHNLGVIIHHKDNNLLKRLVIVNPDWATDALYKVLDSEPALRKKGRFDNLDLNSIWKDSEHKDVIPELIDLMIKYELCFEISSRKGLYIAPSILPHDKIGYPEIKRVGSIKVVYDYEFMPAGILTRLIVKAHDWIEKEYYWRTGCIFIFNSSGKARAEVIAKTATRKISITIEGNQQAKKICWR